MTTFKGAVVGAVPTATGPKGRARWRNESVSAILRDVGNIMKPPASAEFFLICFFLFGTSAGDSGFFLDDRWTLRRVLRGSNCVWEISR